MTPIVSVEDVANAFRYDETEYPYIEMLILSAQRYLYNAGAFSPSDKRTEDAIYTYVGISLENRDGMGYDYKNTEHLSSSLTSLINSLRHTPNVPIKQPPSEVSDNA
ncbi:head-tail connector protein [Ignavigranum ruoffiae]|uniref:head-tail connector protein n=1 Tax=Ignavigranum ruoffiae TaxID=89093 RepID=UPI0023570755|nr:head-tail connector protein [Ignavigranum ruoffiae]